MAKFNNNDLKNDIEKIKGYNTAEIKSSCDKNLDATYILDINDSSYFYTYREERDADLEKLKSILKGDVKDKKSEANGELIKFRARTDLSLQIQKLLADFKSKEEPLYVFKDKDVNAVLADLLNKRLSR